MKQLFSTSIILGVALVLLFQNCGRSDGNLASDSSTGLVNCSVSLKDSSGRAKSIFNIGDVMNFSVNSTVGGATALLDVFDQSNTVFDSKTFSSPGSQQVVYSQSKLSGTYSYVAHIQSNGSNLCSTGLQTLVLRPPAATGASCALTMSPTGNQTTGTTLNYSVVSSPAGLPVNLFATKNGSTVSLAANSSATSFSEALDSTAVGPNTRFAQVVDSTGSTVTCSPQYSFNVSVPVPTTCPAGSNGNCTYASVSNGQSSGTCPASYSGACSATCSAGLWVNPTNSCTPPPPPPNGCGASTIGSCTYPALSSSSSGGACIAGYNGSCSVSCSNGTPTLVSSSCAVPPPPPPPPPPPTPTPPPPPPPVVTLSASNIAPDGGMPITLTWTISNYSGYVEVYGQIEGSTAGVFYVGCTTTTGSSVQQFGARINDKYVDYYTRPVPACNPSPTAIPACTDPRMCTTIQIDWIQSGCLKC